MRLSAFVSPLAFSALILSVLLLGLGTSIGLSREALDRPNIIYILADDLGYGDISPAPFNQQLIRTPGLQRMADQGMVFSDHYAPVPVCQPTRNCIMLGVHNGNSETRDNTNYAIPDEKVTIAEVLKTRGYRTAIIGKWGLGSLGTTGAPLNQGFDYFMGYTSQTAAHTYYPTKMQRNNEDFSIPANLNDARGVYSHDLMTAEALAFIEREQAAPFFLYLPYTIPHNDQVAPYDSVAEYVGQFPENPNNDSDTPNASIAGQITRMDRDICRILCLLEELGIAENTLVIFDSDNGPTSIGGNSVSLFDSNGPFKGEKRSLLEGGIRVPMVAWWPGTIAPGTSSDLATVAYNFYPTFADAAGATVPAGVELDGRSILPTLLGQSQPDQDFLYWEFQGNQAIRIGTMKGYRPDGDPAKLRIYDLPNDPAENSNLVSSFPALAAEMNALMDVNESVDFANLP